MEDSMTKRTRMMALFGALMLTAAIAAVWVQGTIAAEAPFPAMLVIYRMLQPLR
jgi:hypothetical protein